MHVVVSWNKYRILNSYEMYSEDWYTVLSIITGLEVQALKKEAIKITVDQLGDGLFFEDYIYQDMVKLTYV